MGSASGIVKANIPGMQDVTSQLASVKAMVIDVVSDANKIKMMGETAFQGAGGEGFQEDYTRIIALTDVLSQKLEQSEQAVVQAQEGMIQRDMSIKAQYV